MIVPPPDNAPQPYDHVHLHPDNRLGVDPRTPFLVADTEPPGTYTLWHLADHPEHHDWAAAVTLDDIALAVRVTTTDTRTWTPTP
ncbi:DUF6211 family protein [Streptomyces sp. NPDC093093]|uniref:DUF6211 family protein n=1 Tax=Streptomyces sp. NPDC093093 TaxID=3366025 RepID=UPI00382C142E